MCADKSLRMSQWECLFANMTAILTYLGMIYIEWNMQKQGTHSNYIFKFPVFSQFFPCLTASFPCANLSDLWLLLTKNWLAGSSSFNKFLEIFTANFEISFTFRIREFTTWANQIPCVFPVFWQNFQIYCVFPDRELFLVIFPVFPV